ncbi:MAG: DUF2141 domain-containing protein [Melioribacteraceae bacterium]
MKLFKLLVFTISLLFTSATVAQNGNVYLEVSGIDEIEGELSIGLFKNQETFLKKGEGVEGVYLKIEDSIVSYIFKNIPSGNYAIAIYHDENSNKELDRNFLGMPSEDYVFSNYASGSFSPPSFEDAMFTLTDSIKIELNINE